MMARPQCETPLIDDASDKLYILFKTCVFTYTTFCMSFLLLLMIITLKKHLSQDCVLLGGGMKVMWEKKLCPFTVKDIFS